MLIGLAGLLADWLIAFADWLAPVPFDPGSHLADGAPAPAALLPLVVHACAPLLPLLLLLLPLLLLAYSVSAASAAIARSFVVCDVIPPAGDRLFTNPQ